MREENQERRCRLKLTATSLIMTLTIAFPNEKGGVAKTATCVNLAGCLVEQGFRCLIVDFDPQGSSGEHLGVVSSGEELLGALLGDQRLEDQVHETPSGIDVIPAGPQLQGLVEVNRRARERLLERALGELPSEHWDFILIDSPARNDLLADNVLVASDLALVPVECKNQSLTPLLRLVDTIIQIQGEFGSPKGIIGIVPTRFRSLTNMSGDFVAALRAQFGATVFDTVIRESTHVAEAPRKHVPVCAYAPQSLGAIDYRQLTDEFLRRVAEISIEYLRGRNGARAET